MAVLLLGFVGTAFAQSVTVDVPSGCKVVVVPSSVNVPQAVSVATAPQTVYIAPAPASASVYRAHPYTQHMASVGEGMVIEHQIDDHHQVVARPKQPQYWSVKIFGEWQAGQGVYAAIRQYVTDRRMTAQTPYPAYSVILLSTQ